MAGGGIFLARLVVAHCIWSWYERLASGPRLWPRDRFAWLRKPACEGGSLGLQLGVDWHNCTDQSLALRGMQTAREADCLAIGLSCCLHSSQLSSSPAVAPTAKASISLILPRQ